MARNEVDSNSSNQERVGHKRAVASPGNSLRAHECGGLLACQRDGTFESRLEVRGLHVIGKSTKTGAVPSQIHRVGPSRVKPAQEFHFDWADFEDRHKLMLNAFETGKVALDEYLQWTVFCRERRFTPGEFKAFMFEQSQPLPESLESLAVFAHMRRYMLAALNNESFELNEYRI